MYDYVDKIVLLQTQTRKKNRTSAYHRLCTQYHRQHTVETTAACL